MKNLSIRLKLHGAFLLMLAVLAVLGYYAFERMDSYSEEMARSNEQANKIANLSLEATVLFKKQVQEWKNMLIRGHVQKDYDKYSAQFEDMRLQTQNAVKQLRRLAEGYPDIIKAADQFLVEHDRLTEQYHAAIPLLFMNKDGLGYRDVDDKVRGIDRAPTDAIQHIAEQAQRLKIQTAKTTEESIAQFKQETATLGLALVFLLISLYVAVVEFSVLKPVRFLTALVNKISQGDYEARAKAVAKDEIGILARSFDALLDERAEKLAASEKARAELNNSVIALLQSVARLSQRDLTVNIPVSEDITGTLSDAINLLAQETASTLKDVNQVSERVNLSSSKVKSQSDAVMVFAEQERMETEKMLEELNSAVMMMLNVARISQTTNNSSKEAMQATDTALQAVTDTVQSINKIREIIREIEKRVKRLGERSQEIAGAVNIINEIAERTHVLALNAGMQAAQAGEAGRGFMVVANEVQRLAESSREATGQISLLVKNIQVDTADAVNTMNDVITQVVEGTRLAEEAGDRMKDTRNVTVKLVEYVHDIADKAMKQVKLGQILKERATVIQQSTKKTHIQLQAQSQLSEGLVNDAETLLKKVRVFRLPA
ncbi:methyl-accepting chemotaxis protein [Methylobacter sp. BlB1]|uniref:methyl-accepting chemotaxis protein n=1 Tax=Methylobacter sp. BlB1 TaxID=2785914 RepID=UPI001893E577|nr:methyl-accepting chemotaxis protein [Methylobacter sp. BlB1]MBF6650774.1 HAMP domain-containing protein [Methylobacter sp. BlB1]